jgi:hypothetical protein
LVIYYWGVLVKRLLLPVFFVVGVTGCASQAPAAEPVVSSAPTSEAPKVLTPGTYSFETPSGAKGTIELPGKPEAGVEALRVLGKGPKTTYVTMHVDNRQGSTDVNMYGISVFTPAGEEIKYEGASQYIDSITPKDAPSEVTNKFIAGYNKHNDIAPPKAVKDFVLTGPAVPAEFTGVTVYPFGAYDPVEAAPAS